MVSLILHLEPYLKLHLEDQIVEVDQLLAIVSRGREILTEEFVHRVAVGPESSKAQQEIMGQQTC